MADTTESSETMTRDQLAEYLREIAAEFESEGDANVRVGNKSVTLTPSDQITCEVEVIERGSMLRGDQEALDIEVSWKAGR